MIYNCVICNRDCKIINNKLQFVDFNETIDVKDKLKFCCNLCQKTEIGQKYLQVQKVKKLISSNIFYIIISTIGIIIYIIMLIQLIK